MTPPCCLRKPPISSAGWGHPALHRNFPSRIPILSMCARRALPIYYLLFIISYLLFKLPLPPPSRIPLTFPRGLSRGLTKPHWGFVVGRYAKRPTRPVLVPDGAPVRSIPGNRNKKTPRNFLRGVCFGAPSGTRTQDPLIKSQLLSLVAHTHGVCCCNKKHFSNDQNH